MIMLMPNSSAVGSVQDLRTGDKKFESLAWSFCVYGLVIVIATSIISLSLQIRVSAIVMYVIARNITPISLLIIISAIGMWESSYLLVNIERRTSERNVCKT